MQSRNQSITNKNLESKGIVMLVKDLVKLCYGEIEIFTNCRDSVSYEINFKTLYQGERENVPLELLERTIRYFNSYEKGVINICVLGD